MGTSAGAYELNLECSSTSFFVNRRKSWDRFRIKFHE